MRTAGTWDVWRRVAAYIVVVTCREDMALTEKYNIKLDLKVIGWEGVDCTHLAKDTIKWRSGVKEA
jgi:hypothetical protein